MHIIVPDHPDLPDELPSPYGHGTYSTYIGRKCRCRACKDAHSAYQRSWRARKRAEREAQGRAS